MKDDIEALKPPSRFLRALKLERSLYREAAEDPKGFLPQGLAMAVLASVAAAFGSSLGMGKNFFIWALTALIGWFIWAFMIYALGMVFSHSAFRRAAPGQVVSALGYASAPGLLKVLGAVPGITLYVFVASTLWMIVAAVLAVKEATGARGHVRLALITIAAWVVQAVLIAVLTVRLKASRL